VTYFTDCSSVLEQQQQRGGWTLREAAKKS